jgi:hypothetical protein
MGMAKSFVNFPHHASLFKGNSLYLTVKYRKKITANIPYYDS